MQFAEEMDISQFFKGLKVIELAGVLAGPATGMFFAELGAEVIKIENKNTGGDGIRKWRLPGEQASGPSAYFCSINHGKTHLLKDLKNAEEQAEVLALIADADMVISNFLPETAKKLGMQAEVLCAAYPELIFLQVEGFESGHRQAYDVVLQAETGWISMTGTADGEPCKLPVALIDLLAAHQLKEAALLALLKRARGGGGSYLSCSLERASLASLANQASNYLMCGHVAGRMGTLHPNIAPYGECISCSDGVQIVLAVGSDTQFEGLCRALEIEDDEIKARYASNGQRLQARDALGALIAGRMGKQPSRHWEQKFEAEGVPHGRVRPMDEVMETAVARDMIREEMMEGRLTKRLSSVAFRSRSGGA